MNKCLIIVFILITHISFAQLQIDWQNCFIGPGDDRVESVLALDDGYFILGTYNSVDVWLIRTDLYGNFLWDKKYGGSQNDFGEKILKANDGNYIIVALSASSDFDLINNPYPNSANFWIYKINPSGNIIWSRVVGGNGADWPQNATITIDSGVVAVGQSQSYDGDVGINYGYWDIWAVKLDSNGNKVWAEVFGAESAEWADEVITTDDGSVLMGGTATNVGIGNIDCDPFNEWWGESLIMKFDSDMNLLWQQCYGGGSHELNASITPIETGYYASHYAHSNDGDLSNSGYHGEADIWITKLDTSGNFAWGKCYGGSNNEGPDHTFNHLNNDLTFFGTTSSNDGDVSGNHSQGSDIWVVKTDSSGTIKWQQCIGGFGNEPDVAVRKISDNTYVIASMTLVTSGDVSCTTTIETGYDIWFFQVTDTTVVSTNELIPLSWNIYPNPASDYITIELEKQSGNWESASIYDCTGRMVHSQTITESKIGLQLQDLPSGFYYASLIGDNGMTPFKKLVLIK